VAIVVGVLAALPVLFSGGALDASLLWALVGGGGLVAVVGFLDDHGHVAARWRLLAHFAAAAWALIWLDGSPPLVVFGLMLEGGWVGAAIAAVYLVWLLNLYNFMDGIDGIAGVEAICVCVGAAALYVLTGHPDRLVGPLLPAAAAAGFLYWNFPPARIFMGDAGSGFLGIVLGILSLQAASVSPSFLWSWLILLGIFIVDATWTLFRRLLRGDRVYEAHRSHAYQHAALRCGAHLPVTLAVGGINLFWLLPIALCVGVGLLDGVAGVAIAYAPLLALAIRLRAGESEETDA
jgi:glycosyltransferase WbpL